MKKIVFGTLGLLLIVIIISGCTSEHKQTLIFDQNVGGDGTPVKYVNVPDNVNITVEISNSTSIGRPSTINIYGLTVEGQNGQATSNYIDNIVDEKSFNITNGFNGNATLKSGLKSVAIVPNGAKANLKIIATT